MSAPDTTVAVIGAGTMGRGIAYVALAAGHTVSLYDADADALGAALGRITAAFEKGIERGKVTAELRDESLAHLTVATDLSTALAGAAVVIEAVPERIQLKREVFRAAEDAAPAGAMLATNTSSLPVSSIAKAVADQGRVVGLHFFNPVPAMRLVEIVRGDETTDATIARARAFAESLGKTPIVVRDSPGFATSRLGVVLGLEAIRMVEQGIASPEDIDRAMELGYNHPMGPLRLGDMVGLDVRLAIADHLFATLGGDTWRAPELLRRMVSEGKLGQKSGEGFYRWS